MLMRRSFATAALFGALVLGGCSVPSNAPDAYNEQTKSNFVLGCSKSAPEASDFSDDSDTTTVPQDNCECRYEWITENIPYDSEQRDNDPAFADYDGPTFESLDDDAGSGEALPKNILDALEEECPLGSAPASTTTTTEG